uniref:Uncharacterized protein n=1 Tax=Ananas comosus var. bracteatus TaxID=296719 RepID=A0A6V7PVI5_ANACO|nr:unnamed protein product [Ananas comosus var. bracteatus]
MRGGLERARARVAERICRTSAPCEATGGGGERGTGGIERQLSASRPRLSLSSVPPLSRSDPASLSPISPPGSAALLSPSSLSSRSAHPPLPLLRSSKPPRLASSSAAIVAASSRGTPWRGGDVLGDEFFADFANSARVADNESRRFALLSSDSVFPVSQDKLALWNADQSRSAIINPGGSCISAAVATDPHSIAERVSS